MIILRKSSLLTATYTMYADFSIVKYEVSTSRCKIMISKQWSGVILSECMTSLTQTGKRYSSTGRSLDSLRKHFNSNLQQTRVPCRGNLKYLLRLQHKRAAARSLMFTQLSLHSLTTMTTYAEGINLHIAKGC